MELLLITCLILVCGALASLAALVVWTVVTFDGDLDPEPDVEHYSNRGDSW